MVCLDLCQWSSLSVMLWLFEANLLQSDRGFSVQARPKQALHDTSIAKDFYKIFKDCAVLPAIGACLTLCHL